MTVMVIPNPLDEITAGLFILSLYILAIVFIRAGTRKGWYLNIGKDERGLFRVPEQAISFSRYMASDDYVNDIVRKGAYAIIWFYVVFLILIMATVGGSVISNGNPAFKIPCLMLIIIMQFIALSKPVILVGEIIENLLLKTLAMVYISQVQKINPMSIHYTRTPKSKHIVDSILKSWRI